MGLLVQWAIDFQPIWVQHFAATQWHLKLLRSVSHLCLTPQPSIACYGSNTDFTPDELEALDNEGRAILTEHTLPEGKSVVIINVYCPRADKENKERVDFKMNFYKLLQERAESLVNAGRYRNCMFLLFGFFSFY